MPSIVAGWENFFVAEVGAAAAMTGLLFVAVSINLRQILEVKHLPERAGETLIVLLAVLIIASFGLVPRQSACAFGLEMSLVGFCTWLFSVRRQMIAYRDQHVRQWIATRAAMTQGATLPFVLGGALLATGHAWAIYAVVPGTLLSFAAGALNAWVFLVEIQR